MNRSRLAGFAAGACVFAVVAVSQAAAQGFINYLSASGAVTIAPDKTGSISGTPYTLTYDPGIAINAAIGHDWGNGFRNEIEVGYAQSELGELKFNSGSVEQHTDGNDLFSLTVNGFYDIETGSTILPYVGGGIGLGRVEYAHARGAVGAGGIVVPGEQNTDALAFGEVGVAVPAIGNLLLTFAYRYLYVFDSDDSVDADSAHMLKVGLRVPF